MDKDIYQIISDIDKYIKLNKLYLSKEFHGSGKFDFHSVYSNQYQNYAPYSVDYEVLVKSLKNTGIIFEPKTAYQAGTVKTSQGDYFLMSNYGAEDHFYETFLNKGVYFVTGFISNKGHLIVATYSKNFDPTVYEEKFNPIKEEGKSPFILHEALKVKRPFYFKSEGQDEDYKLTLNIDTSAYKVNNFQAFLKLNSYLLYENIPLSKKKNSYSDEYLSLSLSSKDKFKWSTVAKCIEKLSTDYFNDTDMNILNRADMVAYLVSHTQRIESELNILKPEEKAQILTIFKDKADFMNLMPESINLNYKSIYKQFPVEKGYDEDYGAERLNKMFNFINFQLSLKSDKKDNKRLKI